MNRKRAFLVAASLGWGALFGLESVKPTGCSGPVLCPPTPMDSCSGCCKNWHVDIGLLYQQPAFTGMIAGYRYEPDIEDHFEDTNVQDITVLQECLRYGLGVTASLGYTTSRDDWYFGARFDFVTAESYSYYDTHNFPATDTGVNLNMQAQITIGDDPDLFFYDFQNLDYHAEMDVYVLDIHLKRGSYFSKSHIFTPYAGVKAVWFKAKQFIEYSSPSNGDFENPVSWLEIEKNWGVGPMFGFEGEYRFLERVSLFSDSDIAVLYGEANTVQTSTLIGLPDPNISTGPSVDRVVDLINNVACQFYLPVRSILGVKIDNCMTAEKDYIALKIGYDLRVVISYPNDENGFAMGGLYTNLVWSF